MEYSFSSLSKLAKHICKRTEHNIQKFKNIISKIRNSVDGLLSRLDRTEKNNSDLECTYGKNYHNAGQKYGKTKTMENEWLRDT